MTALKIYTCSHWSHLFSIWKYTCLHWYTQKLHMFILYTLKFTYVWKRCVQSKWRTESEKKIVGKNPYWIWLCVWCGKALRSFVRSGSFGNREKDWWFLQQFLAFKLRHQKRGLSRVTQSSARHVHVICSINYFNLSKFCSENEFRTRLDFDLSNPFSKRIFDNSSKSYPRLKCCSLLFPRN